MGNSRASPCAVSPRTPSWGLTFLGIGMPLVIYGALFCIFLFLAMVRIATALGNRHRLAREKRETADGARSD